ncbi:MULTISPECIES: hypothetical protein [unclassified Mycobacterium]|uniref:hypothetical protein n=1 Tax=unclassified Mycobacterium TaxID=2642494 RepID=UPI0029C79750|nr:MULTISPECIES: hypothetical protein [unclassified Mycobacterium]
MNTNSSDFSGVGVAGMSWTLRVAGATPAAQSAAIGHHAIPRPKRRTAAATVASVNRGTT